MLVSSLAVRVGLRDALHVVREAAGGQHHAIARQHALSGLARQHADRATLLDQHLARRCGGQDRDAQIQRRFRQSRRQGIATGHVHGAAVARQFHHMAGQTPGYVHEGSERLGNAEEVLEIGVRRVEHHADEGDGLQRWLQPGHVAPQAADVVGLGQDGAADIGPTFDIRVVVGVERGHETHRGLTLEEVHHLRPVVDEGLNRSFVKKGPRLAHQVGAHSLCRVGGVLLAAMVAQRYPQHTARECRGAAKDRFLFQHHDIEPALARRDGGGQASGAGADHHQVAHFRQSHIAPSVSPCSV